jgi:hypothetical protein
MQMMDVARYTEKELEASRAVRVSARLQLHEGDYALAIQLSAVEQRGILWWTQRTHNVGGNNRREKMRGFCHSIKVLKVFKYQR